MIQQSISSTMQKMRKALLLVTIPIIIFLLFTTTKNPNDPTPTPLHVAKSICDGTLHTDLCISTLLSVPDLGRRSLPHIISTTLGITVGEVRLSATNCSGIRRKLPKLDALQQHALDDCLELFNDTIDYLHVCISELSNTTTTTSTKYNITSNDLQTLLSAAITNQHSCLNGFSLGDVIRKQIEERLCHVSHMLSNSLALLKKKTSPRVEKEVFSGYGEVLDGFPTWVSRKDRRRLLQAGFMTKPDLIVAKDGSGKYMTISDAVAAAPNRSETRFVIYIKAGFYLENVYVGEEKTNLMFIGDGIQKTVVKADRSERGGYHISKSATVAVDGNNFMAQDITVENSAGPSNHQAVALRSNSETSTFYRCSFVGYQDTLYVQRFRQFYRECDIYGTIDVIFGDASVVFQNCNLYARKPNSNQQIVFTAQGRHEPNRNSGISIQNCKVTAAADLIPVKSSFKTYLGRPWKNYSRTVYMQSFLDDFIDPAGWLEWDGAVPPNTLYYGEYMNWGPGANTSGRVKWLGYRVLTSKEASQFTVQNLIGGNVWLPSTQVPFVPGL